MHAPDERKIQVRLLGGVPINNYMRYCEFTESTNQTGRIKLSLYQQEDGTVYNLVLLLEDFLTTVDDIPESWVNPKELFATQVWIDPVAGGGDEVIPGYTDYPVVVKTKDGKMHILDGHHRVDRAIKRGDDKIEVYLAPINL